MRYDSTQPILAFGEREITQVLAIAREQIECVEPRLIVMK